MNAVVTLALAGAVLAQCDQALDIPTVVDPDLKIDEVNGTLGPVPTVVALRSLIVRASAYSYTGSRTRTGTVPHWGTVAVDPTVIPLGSRLLIDGFPGTVFVAEDTGGAVYGNRIDIYFESYNAAIQFGVQQRTVTVLR